MIPLAVPNFVGNEKKYVSEAIESSWVSTGGAKITEFENKIADYVKSAGAVAVQSGTAGLHLALIEVGVKPGDLVIVPTLTFIAAVNPARYCFADPVFMDCDDGLCMDANKLEEFLRGECEKKNGVCVHKASGKTVRAAVVVHVFGNLADMEKIIDVCGEYGVAVVEDATEALGSYYEKGKYAGRFAGTVGNVGVYSFNGNKIITTGGGGMVVSENKKALEHIRYLSQQAKNDVVYFVHNEMGYNYRMTNLQAALGVAQLECIENFITVKTNNYDSYVKRGMKLLPFSDGIRSNKWFYSLITSGTEERDGLIKFLTEKHIQSRPIWTLIHTLPMYKDSIAYKIEKAIYYQDRIVNIPCSTSLTEKDVAEVCGAIGEFYNA